MRKRRFVCGIALCLALSVAGCGKSSEEKQAAKYYQDELGLDKEEAESLAHEVYGKDDEDPGVPEGGSQETVPEPLPELVNSEWYECKVQIYDMVFNFCPGMKEEEIRKIVEGSAYDAELTETFDINGEICLEYLMVNGKRAALWQRRSYSSEEAAKYGLSEGVYYDPCYLSDYFGLECEYRWDKVSIEVMDLKTREDVLTYLAENGFVEVEKEQSTYERARGFLRTTVSSTSGDPVEYADIPHYFCEGVQRITIYRIHKLGETDQEIEQDRSRYSGAHQNLVNCLSFEFNTDGTINVLPQFDQYSKYYRESYGWEGWIAPGMYVPSCYSMREFTREFEILGEKIN